MKEIGYDLTRHSSKGLDQFNGQDFDVAVTMGCGDECPLVHAKRREEWQIPDPKELPPYHDAPSLRIRRSPRADAC